MEAPDSVEGMNAASLPEAQAHLFNLTGLMTGRHSPKVGPKVEKDVDWQISGCVCVCVCVSVIKNHRPRTWQGTAVGHESSSPTKVRFRV